MENTKMILQIEKRTPNDAAVNAIYSFLKKNTFENTKLYVSIYHPHLMIGKGSSHVWIKDKSNIDVRLAIIFI